MRGCAERKNLLPSAASSAHGQLCSLRGFAAKIHFMAGASSFPQNALRWRFVGALGNPHFETSIRRGDPVWSPGNVTLDPVRKCTEWKNKQMGQMLTPLHIRLKSKSFPNMGKLFSYLFSFLAIIQLFLLYGVFSSVKPAR